jgi:small subunit ribosomal protein S20
VADSYTARQTAPGRKSGPIRFSQPAAPVLPFPGGGRRFWTSSKDYSMANTSSAKKAARQMIRRTEVNKARRSRVKSEIRAVEEAIKAGDQGKAQAALAAAEPILVRNAQKGIMHKKTASRKVSRLAQRVKAMSA